jgi:hypothetical protein
MSAFYTFLVAHWAAIGLTVSEIMALLPGKYSGIVQTVLKIIGYFIPKNTVPK